MDSGMGVRVRTIPIDTVEMRDMFMMFQTASTDNAFHLDSLAHSVSMGYINTDGAG